MLEIRKLSEEERAASYRLSQYSFGFWSDDEISEQELARINRDVTLAGFVDGELVAKVTNWPFQQSVRGVMKRCAGIAGVATDPLHRRKGYGRQLLKATFEKIHEQGQVVSSLYPFLESFYAKFGYVTTNDQLQLTFPTRNLAHHLPYAKLPDGWSIERLKAADAFAQYRAFLRDIAPTYHGFVVRESLDEYTWRNYIAKDQLVIFLQHNGRTVGTARYKVESNLSSGKLTIYDIYWHTLPARDHLFGFFAMHDVNLPETTMTVPMGVNFHTWFRDPTTPYKLYVDHTAMMCRVIDPIGALEGLPAEKNGRFTFQYKDPHCPWVEGTYELVGKDGRLYCHRIHQNATTSLTTQGLSALIFGTLSVEELLHLGWGSHISTREQTILKVWFPPCLLFNPNHF